MRLHLKECPLPVALPKGKAFQSLLRGREREDTHCIAILNEHHKKETHNIPFHEQNTGLSASPRYNEREPSLAEGVGIYNGAIMASIAELREAQLPLARLLGDESLHASLRNLDAGGPNNAKLKHDRRPR